MVDQKIFFSISNGNLLTPTIVISKTIIGNLSTISVLRFVCYFLWFRPQLTRFLSFYPQILNTVFSELTDCRILIAVNCDKTPA